VTLPEAIREDEECVVYIQLRRAFYSGFGAMVGMAWTLGGIVDEYDGLRHLKRLADEIEKVSAQVVMTETLRIGENKRGQN